MLLMGSRATPNPNSPKLARGIGLPLLLTPPAAGIRCVNAKCDAAIRLVGQPDVAGTVERQVEEALFPKESRGVTLVVIIIEPLKSESWTRRSLVVEEGWRRRGSG